MKNFVCILFSLLMLASCINTNKNNLISSNDGASENIVTVESILKDISEPLIPDIQIDLMDFGAGNDGTEDYKHAFDAAISELKRQGGGKLIVPRGTYLVNGPIHLISNMELHLKQGAKIVFGSKPDFYLPVVKTSWEGTFLYNYSPFIYAYKCTNVCISGKGIVDGDASMTWNNWKAKQKDGQMLSREMNHNKVDIEERVFGDSYFLRPHLIQFYDCKNVKVEGIRIEDSPFWCLHLLRCENVIVRGVSYDAQNKNNDGIDPEYSRNVLIEDVIFNNSDDNIAIKAGRDDDGRSSDALSENIVVRNCKFKGLHAIVIGSEMSAGVKNVFVQNCTFGGHLKRGVYLKSNPDRGGFIKNIYVKNVDFGEVVDCFYITSYYHNEGKGHATEIKDIYFENINCKKATDNGIVIQGFPEKKVSEVYFTNIKIDSAANPISMESAENIVFNDVIIGKSATAPSFVK